jgi:hypothetical protein
VLLEHLVQRVHKLLEGLPHTHGPLGP